MRMMMTLTTIALSRRRLTRLSPRRRTIGRRGGMRGAPPSASFPYSSSSARSSSYGAPDPRVGRRGAGGGTGGDDGRGSDGRGVVVVGIPSSSPADDADDVSYRRRRRIGIGGCG